MPHDIPIDGGGIERPVELFRRTVVFDRPEERAGAVVAVQSESQGFLDQPLGRRGDGNEADLVALALDPEVKDALAAVQILDAQPAEFLAADSVIKQGGQDGTIA